MNEAMLKEIITRILSSPELQSLITVDSEVPGAKPGCLVLLNNQESVCQLTALEERYRQDYYLRVCVDGPIELAKNINRVSYEEAMRESQWERIHVPVCSADQLAQIALGLCTDHTTKLISRGIIAGIPVEIERVNWEFTARTPEKYRQIFENYVRQVVGFGVIIAENYFSLQQPAVLVSGGSKEPQSSQVSCEQQLHSDVRYEKRLLSGKEALQLPGNGVLQIDKSTVLTPTAIDVLKQQKIEVYREGVRCL